MPRWFGGGVLWRRGEDGQVTLVNASHNCGIFGYCEKMSKGGMVGEDVAYGAAGKHGVLARVQPPAPAVLRGWPRSLPGPRHATDAAAADVRAPAH